jgi:hypothetical protein
MFTCLNCFPMHHLLNIKLLSSLNIKPVMMEFATWNLRTQMQKKRSYWEPLTRWISERELVSLFSDYCSLWSVGWTSLLAKVCFLSSQMSTLFLFFLKIIRSSLHFVKNLNNPQEMIFQEQWLFFLVLFAILNFPLRFVTFLQNFK